jgi:putative transposase
MILESSLHRDVADFEGKDWQEADERFKAIKPLLDSANPTREQVQLRAQQLNKDVSIYRWIQRYKAHGVTSALIPIKRGWQAGKSRLNPDQDAIIAEVLNDYYLKGQRSTIAKTVQEVERRCSLRASKNRVHLLFKSAYPECSTRTSPGRYCIPW